MGVTSINIECVDQKLYITNRPLIASGGQKEDQIVFSFCSLWSGFGKTAVFYRNPSEVYNVAVADDKCLIPTEVLTDEGEFFFGVFGSKGDIKRTSEVIKYSVVQGAAIEGSAPSAPTPDIYDQIMTKLGEIDAQAVRKTGADVTGKLTMGTGSAVRNGENGWASFGFETSDGRSRGNIMVTDGNTFHVNVKETGATYADRYMLPAPTEEKTADNWYSILTTKSPVSIPQGGTGVDNLPALMARLNNSYNNGVGSVSAVDVFTLAPGVYHCEAATSLDCHYPIAQGYATVEVIGNYRASTTAADGYPNGYWLIRVTYSTGDTFINYRRWNGWLGWKKVNLTDVAAASE